MNNIITKTIERIGEKKGKGKLLERLQIIADSEKETAHFDANIQVQEEYIKPRLKARTCMQTRETFVTYNPSYFNEKSERIYAFVRDSSKHEINHYKYKGVHKGYEFRGCPRNLEHATRLIYEPIFEVLTEKGFSEADSEYAENALEDTILHSDLSPAFDLKGISYFFEEVGDSDKTFSPFYEAHVKMNLMLWGSKSQKRELKKYFSDKKETEDKVEKALREFIEKSGIKDLGSFKVVKNKEVMEERGKIREHLNNEKNWKKIARAYAEAFSPLMEKGYAMPLLNHNGAGTKGRENEDYSEQGNEFQKQRKTKGYKIGRVGEAYRNGDSAPPWIESFEAMGLYYQWRAKKLGIEAKTFTESSRMPILHFGSRKFNPYSDNLSNINFGYDKNGKLEIRKRENSIDIQIPIKQSTIGFPKARFVLMDTSGSMQEDFNGGDSVGSRKIVSWGDKSKYDGALVEFWGFLEWLKENHILDRTGIELDNFSTNTIVGKGLEEAKRIALTPQWDNTYFDLERLKEVFRGKGSVIFTISDGEIANWEDARELFIEGAKKHFYFHLHLGRENKMTKDLNKNKIDVELIPSAEDLEGRVVKLADKFYRG